MFSDIKKKKKSKKIIAIETSNRIMSLALYDTDRIISVYQSELQRDHAEKLIPMLERLMQKAHWLKPPDMVAVDIGPGSFTGIRIGVSTARALAQSWGIPLIGIQSLDVLGEAAGTHDGLICCVLDALRGEVFEAQYTYLSSLKRISDYRLINMQKLLKEFSKTSGHIYFIGTGIELYKQDIAKKLQKKALFASADMHIPRAVEVALRAAKTAKTSSGNYEKVLPFYIRKPAAEERINGSCITAVTSSELRVKSKA